MEREFVLAGRRSDLEEDGYFVVKHADGTDVLVLRAAGILYAVQRRCPHEAAPLEKGQVWDKMIRCGNHGFTFDLETGEGLNCPGYSIQCFEVKESNGEIFLSVLPAGPPEKER